MIEIKVYISEDKLEGNKHLIVKCTSYLQQSESIEEFKNMLENAGLYGEVNQSKNEVYVKVNSSDTSKLLLITSRKRSI